jgi:hypothetical protein
MTVRNDIKYVPLDQLLMQEEAPVKPPIIETLAKTPKKVFLPHHLELEGDRIELDDFV